MQFVLFVANPPLVALFYSPVVEKEAPLILDIPQLRGMMLCPVDQDRTPCSSHVSPARHVGPRTTSFETFESQLGSCWCRQGDAGSSRGAGGTFPGGNHMPVVNSCMHFAAHPLAVSSQRDFSYLILAQRGN